MSEKRMTELLEKAYGNATLTQAVVGATDASASVLAANANRKYALIQNDSNQDVYIMIGAAAVLSTGILLAASGGQFEMSFLKGNVDTRVINAIHAAAGQVKNLLVISG